MVRSCDARAVVAAASSESVEEEARIDVAVA